MLSPSSTYPRSATCSAAAAVTVSRNGADLPTEADVEAGFAAPIRIMSGDGMTVLGKCPLV
jgi:hypothetical protein